MAKASIQNSALNTGKDEQKYVTFSIWSTEQRFIGTLMQCIKYTLKKQVEQKPFFRFALILDANSDQWEWETADFLDVIRSCLPEGQRLFTLEDWQIFNLSPRDPAVIAIYKAEKGSFDSNLNLWRTSRKRVEEWLLFSEKSPAARKALLALYAEGELHLTYYYGTDEARLKRAQRQPPFIGTADECLQYEFAMEAVEGDPSPEHHGDWFPDSLDNWRISNLPPHDPKVIAIYAADGGGKLGLKVDEWLIHEDKSESVTQALLALCTHRTWSANELNAN